MPGKNKVTLTFAGEDTTLSRTVDKVGRSMRKLDEDSDKHIKNVNKNVGLFGVELDQTDNKAKKFLKHFGDSLALGTKPIAITIATAFSASFLGQLGSSLIGGIGKLAHGLGAALALLPAAALGAGLAVGTLKLALFGVQDALKAGLTGDTEAFTEALKGMAPAARVVMTEIVNLKGGFDEMKRSVQANLFGPLVGQITPLAKTYFPIIRSELERIGAAFGQAGASFAGWLRMPTTTLSIADSVFNAGEAVRNLITGVANLVTAFLPLIHVGSTFLPGLTSDFDSLTGRVAAFMNEAERTGRLRDFISGGLSAFGDLYRTAGRLVDLFKIIGDIGSAVFGDIQLTTGDLIGNLTGMATQLRDFLRTGEGAAGVGLAMKTFQSIVNNVFGTLQRVGGILAKTFAPYLPQILDFVSAFMDLKSAILDTGLDALEPVLAGLASVLLGSILPAVTSFARFLADNQPLLQAFGIAIAVVLIPAFYAWAAAAASAALAQLALIWPVLLVGAIVAAFAYLVITHWETIKNVTEIVFSAIVGFIQSAFNWVKENWPTLLLILTGPFGIAVILITKHWDTIKSVIGAVLSWIGDRLGWIKDTIVGHFEAVLGFIRGLPGRIASAASGMWDSISNGFKAMLNLIIGWWNNISFTIPKISIPSVDVPGLGKVGGGSLGGQTFSTPNLPKLHTGGIFKAPPGRSEGLALLLDGEKVTRPEDATGVMPPIIVNVYPAGSVLSERDLFSAIEDGIAQGRIRVSAGR